MSHALRGWTKTQRAVVIASYLGWTLDAFDFFLLVFVLKDVANAFGASIFSVGIAITLTLAMRPLGAYLFGRLADRYGRQPILMLDVGLYSLFGFATAFVPNLAVFLVVRALFGVAMGGEWGVGASLTMETIPVRARGIVSGILQSGYPSGYLLASLAYAGLYSYWGWRGLFLISLAPAMLILYIRSLVPESPGFNRKAAYENRFKPVLLRHWRLGLYVMLLMTAFNFFSHGTQDLYPIFLQQQRHFSSGVVGAIAVFYNVGAILGGLTFGMASQHLGRRRAILTAALCALPVLWLWLYSPSAVTLGLGAFLVQFFVQGAWGVIPAHLNELSPQELRGTFPGTMYQLGNFIAASNVMLQTSLAASRGGDYAFGLAAIAIVAALSIAALVWHGAEAKDVTMVAKTA